MLLCGPDWAGFVSGEIGHILTLSYCKDASIKACYKFEKICFGQKYISVENSLHNQSEKGFMCFKMRPASTRDWTVFVVHKSFMTISCCSWKT